MEKLTQERLKELLFYCSVTGDFVWLVYRSSQANIGDFAGHITDNDYSRIRVDGNSYRAHRLAWLYQEGYFPEYQIDHKDGNKINNRWDNIRHVTRSCNKQNKKIRMDNTSGFMGVLWNKRRNKWWARIMINGLDTCIGSHDDKISAALHRCHYEACCPDWTCNYQAANFIKLRELGFKI